MARVHQLLFCVVCLSISFFGKAALAGDETEVYRTTFEHSWPKTNFSKYTVLPQTFQSGGPARDGIPAINSPKIETLKGGVASGWARQLSPRAPVIVIALNGEARAYPLEVMLWHEIVNDTLGGVPIVATYCPLCNVALVFRRKVEGRMLDFGTTGLLRDSNLVMYDRQTESWWQQFGGRAIVGEWTGTRLAMIPSRVESFAAFARQYPDGEVLIPSNPDMRAYGKTPYVGYDGNQTPPFLNGEVETYPLKPMDSVVVIQGGKSPFAVSMNYLRIVREMNVDGLKIVWRPGMTSVLDSRNVKDGRDLGEVEVERLTPGPKGRVIFFRTFAFAYRSFFPDGVIITRCVNAERHSHADCRP
ncbi:MAG: DUF3179 domain-containing protein [Parvibaculum sp.]